MSDNRMEELIRNNVMFIRKRVTGYEMLKCNICNDYKVRAGFKFENGEIDYHCFNCSHHARYIEGANTVSDKFKQALISFNIDEVEIDNIVAKSFFNKNNKHENVNTDKPKTKNLFSNRSFNEVLLPPNTVEIKDLPDDNIWKIITKEYLESRALSIDSLNWMVSHQKEFAARLIIPYYHGDKLIYWEARLFVDDPRKQRYLSASGADKSIVIFNIANALKYTKSPLYVCEGAFNALSIPGGIALAGSKISPHVIDFLKKINEKRQVVFVLDKKDRQQNGYKLGKIAIENRFAISWISGETKDPNDAVVSMGRLWTITNILENTKTGFAAKISLEQIIR